MAQHSYSRINTFLECPARYDFAYRKKLPQPVTDILMAGSLAHSIFEAYIRYCMAHKVSTELTALPSIAMSVYRAEQQDHMNKGQRYLDHEQYHQLYEEIVEPFGETHMVQLSQIMGVEEELAVDIHLRPTGWMDDTVWFRAKLDLLLSPGGTELELVDFKTGWASKADPLQTQIYAWLLFAQYDHVETVKCSFDFVRFNIRRTVEFHRDQFDELDTAIRAITDRIDRERQFAALPGPHCANCPFASQCPARADAPDMLESIEDAKKLVEAVSIWQRDLGNAQQLLRAWCTEHGPVEHNGAFWGHHAEGGPKFDDAYALAEALEDMDKDPWPYLSVNNRKTPGLLKKHPELKKLTVDGRTTRFGMKKVKE